MYLPQMLYCEVLECKHIIVFQFQLNEVNCLEMSTS